MTLIFFGILTLCIGQPNLTWDKWSWLIGNWAGLGSGQSGKGSGSFTFKTDLDNKILVRRSHSEYPAQGNKPEVIHNDLMIIYPDHSGSPSKAIYFDNEGHTINYSITYMDQSIVLTSDKIPNIPVFRLTYTRLNDEVVNTRFEISPSGEQFNTYLEGESKRTK